MAASAFCIGGGSRPMVSPVARTHRLALLCASCLLFCSLLLRRPWRALAAAPSGATLLAGPSAATGRRLLRRRSSAGAAGATGAATSRPAGTGLAAAAEAASGSPQVALVTGANKGIGREIARKLAVEAGATIVLGCRNAELGLAAARELAASGPSDVIFQRLDLTDAASIRSCSDFIQQQFGRLDVLVNNAAICFNDPTLYGKVPYTPFEQQADITLRTNFFGTLAIIQEMLPLLRASLSPRIINVASWAGRLRGSKEKIAALTSPSLTVAELEFLMREFVTDAGQGVHADRGWPNTCYGVSKMGLIALTKVLAREEPQIMVNSVDPGYCATDQNQHQGYISAERGARAPVLIAGLPPEPHVSGRHFFEEQEISWTYE